MRIAANLSYDGFGYCGWQSQSSGCGVQDAVESAIAEIAGHSVRVHAAGRTDTGVHALSQVIHFETQVNRPDSAWVRGVNAYLPDNVRVEWACQVDDAFHARFSAFSRSYDYLLYNAPVASAIMANKAGWFHQPLNLIEMQSGIEYLIGEHDFSAFRAAACQANTPVRLMHEAKVVQFGSYFKFSFSANAFLHHQVRNMVGALIYIGKGNYPAKHMQTLLTQRDRTLSPPTFSPNGLYLTHVGYAPSWKLPAAAYKAKSLNQIP